MRKYQQLALVLISVISVLVLLMYKSENNRLKYVLQVVNFFGRNDASVLARLEKQNSTMKDVNSPDFSRPLPVWQHIGSNFYTYSSFWIANELAVGGAVVSLVVGAKESIINFKCSLFLENNKKVLGKFAFTRVNNNYYSDSMKDTKINTTSFASYMFLCKMTRDFGTPKSVIFQEAKYKVEYEILLKHMKPPRNRIKTEKWTDFTETTHSLAAICLNLVTYNVPSISTEFTKENRSLQFFMHHQINGFEDFIIYNADIIPKSLKSMLAATPLNIHYLPFNFPFNIRAEEVHQLIEIDCYLRASSGSTFNILLEPNEFLYPSTYIQLQNSLFNTLRKTNNVDSRSKKNDYTGGGTTISKYELTTFSVCFDPNKKYLIDNHFYDPDVQSNHKVFIYRSLTAMGKNVDTILGPILQEQGKDVIKTVPITEIFVHNYIGCVGTKSYLHDWRNSIREDFMENLQRMRNQTTFIF